MFLVKPLFFAIGVALTMNAGSLSAAETPVVNVATAASVLPAVPGTVSASSVGAAVSPVAAATTTRPSVAAPVPVPETARISPVTPADAAFYSEEARLQRRIRLLTLQVKVDELSRKSMASTGAPPPPHADAVAVAPAPMIPSPSSDNHFHGGGDNTVASLTIPMGPAPSPASAGTRLVSVMGLGSSLHATVASGGGTRTVSEGATLSDGWVVQAVTPVAITLSKGRRHKTLRIGD